MSANIERNLNVPMYNHPREMGPYDGPCDDTRPTSDGTRWTPVAGGIACGTVFLTADDLATLIHRAQRYDSERNPESTAYAGPCPVCGLSF